MAKDRTCYLGKGPKLFFPIPTEPHLKAWFDGASEPSNPGPSAWGVVIDNPFGVEIKAFSGEIGWSTNNMAELAGMIQALLWFKLHAPNHPFVLYGDSQWAINQITKGWRVFKPHLVPYVLEARQLCAELWAPIVWIPRENNERADAQSKLGLPQVLSIA